MEESHALITNDAVVLGILMLILAVIFKTSNSSHPTLKKFYGVVPMLLLCYFVPSLLTTFGIVDGEHSKLYFVASRYLLPACLVLLTLSVDLREIARLGKKPIIMFLVGTVGVVLGGPLAILITSAFAPGLRAFIMLGVLAAGFSTLEGVILALSTIFGNDFYGTLARARGVDPEQLKHRLLSVGRIFLVALAPITLVLSWRQIVSPSLSVAIFTQNGVYGLFAATFAPVLFGIFSKRATAGLVLTAAITALVVHFGMYYGHITMYHNNPAVPATFALVISTTVMAIGSMMSKAR